MRKLFYWNAYPTTYRLIFWVLATFFMGLATVVATIQLVGIEAFVPWDIFTIESAYAVDYTIFSKGPFSFSIDAEKRVLTEIFNGGQIPSGIWGSKVMIMLIGLAISIYLATVTLFKRVWYLIAMAGMLLFLILMNVESVFLFGWNDTKVLVLVFVVLLSPSYYLHAFASGLSFLKRLWVMSFAVIALATLIYFFGESEHAFVSLFNYGILAPYILILFFIITVAHEILAGFIIVISGSEGIADRSKLKHFLVISVIYLANILLSYLYIAHYIDWQLVSINPFVLLMVSAVLGIWGAKARASLYVGASSLESLWPILYLVLSIISLGTLIFMMGTVNDPLISVVNDFIIYAHLAIGIAFLLYILYNFIPMIEKGLPVRNVLYNPTNLPYLTYRLLGLMILIALFAVRGFDYPVWYSLGGRYNANADVEKELGEPEIAKAYYESADAFAYHNHKANYNLALLAEKNEPKLADDYYVKAADRWPTSQAIVNRANLLNNGFDLYQSLFALQEGVEIIDDSPELYNNLAVQFEKVKILDSAAYYFEKAGSVNSHVKNNRLAFAAKHGRSLDKDSTALFRGLDRAGEANASAFGYFTNTPNLKNANHMFDMVLLNNWLLSDKVSIENGALNQARKTIDSTSNASYQDRLRYNWSLAAYKNGKFADAIEGFGGLIFSSADWSDRAKLALGKIYLELGSNEQAINLLLDGTGGKFNLELGVAYLENGNPEKAEEFWTRAASAEMGFISEIANEILAVVYSDDPALRDDRLKYLYGRYNKFFIDESAENELLATIDDKNLRIDLALELAKFYHNYQNNEGAKLMLKNIEGLALSMSDYRKYLLLHAIINNSATNVQNQLSEFDSLFEFKESEFVVEATLNHLAGLEQDSLTYYRMATDNPFFADAVLIGIDYYKADPDPFKCYGHLAKAVQLNPESPRLLREYILLSLEVGMDQFAVNGLSEYGQRFSGQSYLMLKEEYDRKVIEINKKLELELNE